MDYYDTSYSLAAAIMVAVGHRKMYYSELLFDNHDGVIISKKSE